MDISSIVYFASIIGIDRTYYEAAEVDGASAWTQIWSITLPLLKQVPMDSGMLFNTTNTIDTFVYRGLLQTNDLGRAAAANFIQSVMGFFLVLGANLIVRKVEKEYALF